MCPEFHDPNMTSHDWARETWEMRDRDPPEDEDEEDEDDEDEDDDEDEKG